MTTPKLSADQIENIIDKLMPIIAEPQDYEFFRGVLTIKLENASSASAAYLINNMLKGANP